MSTEDNAELLVGFSDFNNTFSPYPDDKTIVGLFEEQVAKTPGNIAIRWKNTEITYSELNARANKLAHYLIKCGVKNNDNVGLLVTRGAGIMTGMLAILKAGGAYVPIDPAYPAERQEYIISQSSVTLLLHNASANAAYLTKQVTTVQMDGTGLDEFPATNPGLQISSRQLAYTIYTSGSTGRPKGVMIEHHSAVNLILWVNSTFNVGSSDRLMFITSICFDLSVYDIFGPLSSGGSIVIADEQEIFDLPALSVLLQSYKATFWDSVPTTLDFLIRALETRGEEYVQNDLRLIFLSGDWIPLSLPARIKKYFPNARVISLGGATEATVWSNFYVVNEVGSSWKSIPYGRPIANSFFYILDDNLEPVPHGEQGELFIGGVGVARGYANDKEKSDYSFIPDPFNAPGRMYRTGDLGKMRADWNMEFLGRKDQQVKIRGFRVELGEIESVIRQYKFVDQAVVLAKDIEGVRRLYGYIVPKAKYDRDAMVSFIKRKLPDYMIPGLWLELEALPLTANGKIDRNALPDIKTQSGNEFVLPRNDAERKMAAIWQSVLGLSDISIRDNFFDLGGQSLLAVHLLAEVETMSAKKVQLNSIFKYPTIESLTEFIEKNTAKESVRSLVPIKTEGRKMPLYIIHGDGLNLANFRNLAACLDSEQPVYSLQPKGLDGISETYDKMEEIAAHYINEILEHNPDGPFALAGYSFGGYVAIEMKRQLEERGKTVKMLGIFDTDAANLFYKKSMKKKLFKKLIRQIPKLGFIARSLLRHPADTISYQKMLVEKKTKKHLARFGLMKRPELTGIDLQLSRINEKHLAALSNYDLKPFKGKLHLFKAKVRVYFVDDSKYLGWQKFAKDGVNVYNVPGDHKTMFLSPNVKELARLMQNALDNC